MQATITLNRATILAAIHALTAEAKAHRARATRYVYKEMIESAFRMANEADKHARALKVALEDAEGIAHN